MDLQDWTSWPFERAFRDGLSRRHNAYAQTRRGAQTNRGSLRMGLADDMVPAIRGRYGAKAAERVVDAWNRGMVGDILRKEWEGKGSQVAASYVEGLEAEPWHNVEWYPWVSSLEGKLDIIRDELRLVCSNKRDGPAWVSAAEEDAEAYGPGWQKLPLQDRGWHAENCRLFPKTCGILKPDRGMDQTQSSASPPPADEASPAVPVPLPEKPGSPQKVESTSAKSLGSDSKNVATMAGDADSREATSVDPLGDAAEAERLDGFLADLKSEGLLPGAGTKDDVLAQGPKNRSERRKATKARKKASRPGKRKEG